MTEHEVWDALATVCEPEIGADIVSLGLVYGVTVAADGIRIRMTMTSRRAPVGVVIDLVEQAVWRPGGPPVDVEVVWEPRWGSANVRPEAMGRLSRPVFRGDAP